MKTSNKNKKDCVCPYCDKPVAPQEPICKPCNVVFKYCPNCQNLIATTVKVCPHCETKR